jgi:CBS domain containing-hemolysin-like protein
MITPILLGIACVLACALFDGLETGIYTMNRVRLAVRAGRGDRAARRIRDELLHSNRLLATLIVATNFAHAGISAATTAILKHWSLTPVEDVLVNTLVVIPLALLLGDAIPKELFRVFGNSWVYGCSWVLVASRVVLQWTGIVPVVRLLGEGVSRMLGARRDSAESERRRVLETLREGHRSGVLRESHLEIADRVFGLSERPVSERAVAWRKVVPIPATASEEERQWILRTWGFSRFPVVESRGGRVEVVGVVSALDLLLSPTSSPRELAQPALRIEPGTSVLATARRMRQARCTLALVSTGESVQPMGIVTLKDVLEPIVGANPAW